MATDAEWWGAVNRSTFVRVQLKMAQLLLDAENAAVMLLDDAEENLIFCSSAGTGANKYTGGNKFHNAMRVPLASTGINALVVITGKAICMSGPDSRHNRSVDEAIGTRTERLYSAPLVVGERIVGTLSIINPHTTKPDATRGFRDTDLEIADAVALALKLFLSNNDEVFGGDLADFGSL